MTQIVTNPDHGATISLDGVATELMQRFIDDVTQRLNDNLLGASVQIPPYTVARVPPASVRGLIYVSDESGGGVPAFSDGVNWRRVTDRAVIS